MDLVPAVPSALTDLLGASLAAGFASPLWLAAAGLLVPLAILYMVRAVPRELELPTMRFLHKELGQDQSRPAFGIPRSIFLLLQALVVLLLVLALAGPYVSLGSSAAAAETVIVLDTSASMTTETGDGTRFERAVAAARETTTGETTVVLAGDEPQVLIEDGSATTADQLVATLDPVDTDGDLGAAVAQAASLAEAGERVVVFSDFARETDWRTQVRVARARDRVVSLRQFDGGGDANVGIVDRRFGDGRVFVSVHNFGDGTVERTVAIGDASRSVTLSAGDTVQIGLPIPNNGGTLRLTPGDSFPLDDVAPVAAPPDEAIDLLLLTNDPDRELRTAFDVIRTVNLTVKRPPTTLDGAAFDVVVFGDVAPDRLLGGTVDSARTTLRSGGGVAVIAQPDTAEADLGTLLLLDPAERRENGTVDGILESTLTRDIPFPDPDAYLGGRLARGQSLVSATDGTPLVARGRTTGGPVLLTNYLGNQTAFERNFMYPVFWKRAAFDLSGRAALSEINHATGETLFAENNTLVLPDGTRANGTRTLRQQGVYRLEGRDHAAALLDASESDVAAPAVASDDTDGEGGGGDDEGIERDRFELRPLLLAAAAVFTAGELGLLALRGHL